MILTIPINFGLFARQFCFCPFPVNRNGSFMDGPTDGRTDPLKVMRERILKRQQLYLWTRTRSASGKRRFNAEAILMYF